MPAEKPFTMKLPRTLGATIDMLYTVEEEMVQIAKEVKERVDKLEKKRKFIEDSLSKSFKNADLDGATGNLVTAKLDKKDYPNPKDWDKTYAFIKKNNAFELLHKRLSSTACQERWNAGKTIPGVERFTKVELKLTPRRK